ncbi:YjbH domain-containing protein [Yoonia sp. SS1-5]|uniref:YjbH domain-containing protein n=1 Tax=Yoonia rhodophyticola TaxID=3137370 RepID=A0AAN0NJE8_9RHOB
MRLRTFALAGLGLSFVGGSAAEVAPHVVQARDIVAASNRIAADAPLTDMQTSLRMALAAEGLILEGFAIDGDAAQIQVQNERWDKTAQAAGRAARVMANTLPAGTENLTVTLQEDGVPITDIRTKRSSLQELQFDYDGAWRTLAQAQIGDADGPPTGAPRLTYSLGAFADLTLADPEGKARASIGPQFDVAYRAAPGLTFSGQFRYALLGNADEAADAVQSGLDPVRTGFGQYARAADFEVTRLTARYLFRPGPDLFGRVTAGYLEDMFGGVSTEVLWYPNDSRLALGAELNYVQQRDFDQLFGFQDYDVLTGHASAYYDFSRGYSAQLDLGRYLAGDWGGTFSVDRVFGNGISVGAFVTRTDASFEDFGKGSFDKGVRIALPLSVITGRPSRRRFEQTIRPALRDGGARLDIDERLFGTVRDYRGIGLTDDWGSYLQ